MLFCRAVHQGQSSKQAPVRHSKDASPNLLRRAYRNGVPPSIGRSCSPVSIQEGPSAVHASPPVDPSAQGDRLSTLGRLHRPECLVLAGRKKTSTRPSRTSPPE